MNTFQVHGDDLAETDTPAVILSHRATFESPVTCAHIERFTDDGRAVYCGATVVVAFMEYRTCIAGHSVRVPSPEPVCEICGEGWAEGEEPCEIYDAMPGEPEVAHIDCLMDQRRAQDDPHTSGLIRPWAHP